MRNRAQRGARVIMLAIAAAWSCGVLAAPPTLPQVSGQAWVLVDHDSGMVLVEHAADVALAPASLTKLMSAYLVFEKLTTGDLDIEQPIKVSARAARTNGSRLGLAAGDQINLDALLKAMVVRSANDAAVAIAEQLAGDEASFVAAMNAKAAKLGLTVTKFANATGLDHATQRSSARDMTRLASRLIRDFPDQYEKYFGLREFDYGSARHYNRNLLLRRDDTVDGVKTGRTEAAGYCLIASARRTGMRLIATVMGAGTEDARVQGAERLLAYGFANYETRRILQGEAPATRLRVWLGTEDHLALGVANDLYVTLPQGSFDRLRTHWTMNQDVLAPIEAGQALGRVALDFEGRTLAERPLVALADLARGNIFQRALDRVQLWLR